MRQDSSLSKQSVAAKPVRQTKMANGITGLSHMQNQQACCFCSVLLASSDEQLRIVVDVIIDATYFRAFSLLATTHSAVG